MPTLIKIATYEQSKTAYFLKEKLDNENIDCFFSIAGNSDGEWDEVNVQVKEEDVQRALQIMIQIKEEYGMDIEKIEHANLFRRIIVPTDFSKGSEYACHYAIHLARKIKAEIKLLHVYEDPVVDLSIKESATYLDYMKIALIESEKKAKSGIVDFTFKMKAYMASEGIKDVKIHASIVMGNILGNIKGISKKYKPDVIVLGTPGIHENPRSVFAGLANSMVSGLKIPVYVIPGPCALEDFDQVNILYATDFNEKDNHSLEQLLKIMEPFRKQVTCIHIDTAHNPAKKERMDELNSLLKKEYDPHDIQCRLIEDEDVFTGIKDFADKNHINLLSFTVHKRGIFEKLFKPNLFRKIIQELSLPIMLFPS
ncbi:MAG: universal stress protein [Bacteroidales bacterium]